MAPVFPSETRALYFLYIKIIERFTVETVRGGKIYSMIKIPITTHSRSNVGFIIILIVCGTQKTTDMVSV